MQAVPYMAFTTKSIEPGNSSKPFQSTSYGMGNQTNQPAFAQTFHRAAQELSGQSNEPSLSKPANPTNPPVKEANFKPKGQEVNKIGNSNQGQPLVGTKSPVDPAKTGNKDQANASEYSETTMNLMRQLLDILQMLGLAGDTQLTGQTPGSQADCQPQTGDQSQVDTGLVTSGLAQLSQTPTLAALIKSLAGQDENLQEILGQLQKDLRQLGQQLNENSGIQNSGKDKLAMIRQDLLTALERADGDVLNNQDFLVKLAGAVAKITAKSASGGKNSDPEMLTVAKPDDAGQNAAGSQTSGKGPALGDNHLGVQAQASDKNPNRDGEGAIPSQVAGNDQISKAGSANKLFGQVEAKQIEAKPTEATTVEATTVEATTAEAKIAEAKPAETKPAETKPAETKPAETKPAEAKTTEVVDGKYTGGLEKTGPVNMKGAETASVNSNQSQNEFRLQDQNNVLIQNNADLTQVQGSKVSEPPVNIPRMAQDIFGQITQKAKLLFTPGTTEMQIQLKPDFLGKMNLSITSENGLVTAKFNTESYRVKEVIEANLNTLKDSLAQQGVKVDQLVVNVSSQKDYSGYQEQNHSYYHHNSGKNSKTAGNLNEEGFEKLFSADLESKSIQAYYGNTVDFKA